jgi:pilus assembly protein CpaB
MRRQTVFLLITGVAAVFASLIVYSALRQKDAEVQQARVTTVGIVVAVHDLNLGDKLDANALKFVAWPRDQTPPGSITDPHAVIGSIVKAPFTTNEPIIASKLFIGDKASGLLPLLIPPEMRAMSVAVDEVADISGFVLPHSRVDVVAAMNSHGGDRAKIILENVEVLAVAQDIEGKDKPQVEKIVTFLVTPEQVEQLTLASHEGVLRLALRSYGDNHIVATAGSDVETVMAAYNAGRPRRLVAQTARPHKRADDEVVEIIRNGKNQQQVHFTDDRATAAPAEAGTSDDLEQKHRLQPVEATPVASDTVAQAPAGQARNYGDGADVRDSAQMHDESQQTHRKAAVATADTTPAKQDTVAEGPAGKTIDVP